MSRKPYPTDLTDRQWRLIEPYVPRPKPGGRPARYSRREIVNAGRPSRDTETRFRSVEKIDSEHFRWRVAVARDHAVRREALCELLSDIIQPTAALPCRFFLCGAAACEL